MANYGKRSDWNGHGLNQSSKKWHTKIDAFSLRLYGIVNLIQYYIFWNSNKKLTII